MAAMNKDAASGLVLLLIAALYYAATGSIADSTLSDEVGATGLPRVLTWALAGLGLLLVVRALVAARPTPEPTAEADAEQDARLPRAIGFLLFGAAYVVVLPFLGYLVSTALLIGAVAIFERAERRWVVPVTAIGGAVLYWAIFVKLLGVNQPTGTIWQGLLS
jgi:putative tricarboxylic transport membrane protein